jgi:hypothetical protein
MFFHIDISALSRKKLMQRDYEMKSFIEGKQSEGWSPVNIMTFDEVQAKYHITFDTFILNNDAYEILRSMPDCLDNLKTVLVVNDSQDEEERKFVDEIITDNSFRKVYSKDNEGINYEVFEKVV